MKLTDKNIIMITAGGVGQRFGSDTPKQYISLNGKPVIEYVIEASKKCRLADSILVVADPAYHDMIKLRYGVDVVKSGETLNVSKRNGFDYIKTNSSCKKLVVVEAVRPTVTTAVIEKTFELLDDNDAVACARKVTDSLGRYGEWVVDREEYYTLNPPEGFNFELLEKNFKAESKLTESIQQMPQSTKVYLNFDVPYFDKITYPEDVERLKIMIDGLQAAQQ